jgi:hypothetical protein
MNFETCAPLSRMKVCPLPSVLQLLQHLSCRPILIADGNKHMLPPSPRSAAPMFSFGNTAWGLPVNRATGFSELCLADNRCLIACGVCIASKVPRPLGVCSSVRGFHDNRASAVIDCWLAAETVLHTRFSFPPTNLLQKGKFCLCLETANRLWRNSTQQNCFSLYKISFFLWRWKRVWVFSAHHIVQTGFGAHPTSYPVVPCTLSSGVKRQGREADDSPPSSAVVKNTWVYTSTPASH